MKKIILLSLLCTLLGKVAHASEIKCSYFEDHQQIIHVKGSSEMNLYECMGYFHAKDRLYLMDFFRRAGQGRNAEVLGFNSLQNDFFLRALDLDNRAKKLFEGLDVATKNVMISYTNGVNEVIKNKSWNFGGEFKALGYEPELWEPHQSIIIMLAQSLNQTVKTFRNDLDEAERLEQFGPEAIELFNEETAPWFTPILKKGEFKEKVTTVQTGPAFKTGNLYEFSSEQGSNNWIFSKELSSTKHAMLANDPHLDLKRPSFFYWIHLEHAEVNVIGASIPGIPFIMSGTTPHLTWGLTNSYYDTADAVLVDEQEVKDAETFRPLIKFAWGPLKIPFFFKSYKLINDKYPVIPLPAPKGKALVFRWSGMDVESSDIGHFREVLTAKNVTEAQSIFRKIGIPSWNFVFADHEGSIGYQVIGRLPKRTTKTFGAIPLSVKDLDFTYLPAEENPSTLKPARNFVVTANQRHYPAGSEFIGGGGNSLSMRGNRIEMLLKERLEKNKKLSVKDFEAVQCDTSAHDALFFIPLLKTSLSNSTLSEREKLAKQLLENWDFTTDAACNACPLYRRLMELLKVQYKVNEVALYNLWQKNKIDPLPSFSATVKEMWNEEKGRFTLWDEFHRLYFEHISGREDLNNNESIFTLGDQHSVNPGTARYQNGVMAHYSGASQRVVVEMAKPPRIFLSFPGTNRANFFATQGETWNAWKTCQYQNLHYPVDWTKATLQTNN